MLFTSAANDRHKGFEERVAGLANSNAPAKQRSFSNKFVQPLSSTFDNEKTEKKPRAVLSIHKSISFKFLQEQSNTQLVPDKSRDILGPII